MPTKNPRLNVVLEPPVYNVLNVLAHRKGISLSLLARDLIKEALEIYEDLYWQRVANLREKTFSYKKALSHKDIWE
ncbi:MAG: antitoxin, RHH family protein [Candidatus Omnitrophica bacterium]|nr:antitoxin, RHH family protein [Candidatus Omnitrophota bacterium]